MAKRGSRRCSFHMTTSPCVSDPAAILQGCSVQRQQPTGTRATTFRLLFHFSTQTKHRHPRDKMDNMPPEGPPSGDPSLSTIASHALRSHLEKLPQELYDEIYELTFALPTGVTMYVEPPRRPDGAPQFDPPFPYTLLQVSAGIRKKLATSYYGKNVFVFRSTALAKTWITAMPAKNHLQYLREIRFRSLKKSLTQAMQRTRRQQDSQALLDYVESEHRLGVELCSNHDLFRAQLVFYRLVSLWIGPHWRNGRG